jgi:hypothetical protein
MLTLNRPVDTTSIYIAELPNGYGVAFGGSYIGSFKLIPVYQLNDTQYATALALGLDVSDECYLSCGQIFVTQAQAALQLVDDYIAADTTWKMPAYT